ncbi:MAG: hypothetical protein ACYTGC_19750, partial [Planctomycetota bacterium]
VLSTLMVDPVVTVLVGDDATQRWRASADPVREPGSFGPAAGGEPVTGRGGAFGPGSRRTPGGGAFGPSTRQSPGGGVSGPSSGGAPGGGASGPAAGPRAGALPGPGVVDGSS